MAKRHLCLFRDDREGGAARYDLAVHTATKSVLHTRVYPEWAASWDAVGKALYAFEQEDFPGAADSPDVFYIAQKRIPILEAMGLAIPEEIRACLASTKPT